jgi:hypothetical protein
MPFCIAVPKVSLTCRKTTDFGAVPPLQRSPSGWRRRRRQDHRRGREVAEHELVALLGDRGAAAMLMTNGMPFCSATCAIAVDWPESKAPTRSWAPSLISFSACARHLHVGLGVGVHDLQLGQPRSLRIGPAMSTPRWQSWPMPACAPERGSSTPTFSAAALRAASDDLRSCPSGHVMRLASHR